MPAWKEKTGNRWLRSSPPHFKNKVYVVSPIPQDWTPHCQVLLGSCDVLDSELRDDAHTTELNPVTTSNRLSFPSVDLTVTLGRGSQPQHEAE
jgi:hypothetical protein